MKFGHQLEANIFEEWREKYLQYKWLKHQIADLFPDPVPFYLSIHHSSSYHTIAL
jgi:SPX domain protein involved in polyphosphate accumulation